MIEVGSPVGLQTQECVGLKKIYQCGLTVFCLHCMMRTIGVLSLLFQPFQKGGEAEYHGLRCQTQPVQHHQYTNLLLKRHLLIEREICIAQS